MKRQIRILTLVLCLTGALAGCQGSLFHSDYAKMAGEQWDGQEPLLFDLPVVDESWDGYLWVSVRTVGHFAYEQVVVQAEVRCDGHHVENRSLTVNMHHRDEAHMPNLPYEDNFSELVPLHLKPGKHYTLRLTHRMRLNPLDNIASVGIGLQGDEEEPNR